MLYNVSSYCYYHSFVVAIQVCHSLLSDIFSHISFAFCNSTLEQNLEVNHVISSSYRIQRKEKKETCVYTFFLFLFLHTEVLCLRKRNADLWKVSSRGKSHMCSLQSTDYYIQIGPAYSFNATKHCSLELWLFVICMVCVT